MTDVGSSDESVARAGSQQLPESKLQISVSPTAEEPSQLLT